MKKSVTKNYLYNLIYQILILIFPLITTPYVSRILGAEGIGVYSYTLSIVTYFTLFGSLGIAIYAQREIAYVQDNKEKRSIVFWEVMLLRTITLTISLLIYIFTFAFTGKYSFYYRVLIFEILSSMVDISAFFQGMEEFKKIIKRNLIVKIISIGSIFIFVRKTSDIWVYILIYTLSNFLRNISLWVYLPKYIEKVNFKKLKFKKHLKATMGLFIPQIAIQIYTILDKTMIGTIVSDKAEVGYYEQAQKIVKMIMTVVTSLGTVMLPRIANDFSNGRKKQIKKKILLSFNLVYFLAIPLTFGLIAVAKDLIPWFLGENFKKSIYVTYMISPIIIIIGLSNVIGVQYLLPTKKQKQYTISVVCGAITNLVFNFIFIPRLFSIGAAIGTIIAEMVVTCIQIYYIRKEYKIKDIIFMSIKYFIASLIMLMIILIINRFALNYLSVVIRMIADVAVGIIVYTIILIIFKDDFIKKVYNRVLKIKYK